MSEISKVFYSTNPDSVTLHSRIKLTQTQKDNVIKVREDCLPFIKKMLSEQLGYEIGHWIQGSYKNKTLIRPVKKGQEFDIDVGLYIFAEETRTIDASDAKARLRQTIIDYSNSTSTYTSNVPSPKQNCERLVFDALSFHIDLPLYRFDKTAGKCLLATQSGKWVDSDPKALQEWFANKTSDLDKDHKARLRRLIQYFKAWVALVWRNEPKGRMTSIAITVLAAEFYQQDQFDDSAFMSFAHELETFFSHHEKVTSPVNGDDLLGFDQDQLERFRRELRKLIRIIERIESAQTNSQKFIHWSEIFEYIFPPAREYDWLSEDGRAALPAMTRPPKIRIVHRLKSNQIHRTTVSEDITAYKGEKLEFVIQNRDDYPTSASCAWIVRNQGESALTINDVGHITEGNISETQDENCEYDGVHYMECIITDNRVVLGANSIKVKINGYPRPLRTPPRRKIFKGF